jgi:hypothetical protein
MGAGTRSVDDGVSMRLPGGPQAAAKARGAISQLRADIDPPLMVVLKVLVGRSSVLTEVTDEGPGFDPARTGQPRDASGWGLFLVERLAHRWGVRQEGDATRVWFELRRA